MRDILPDLNRWTANDAQIALATVIETWGSAPRGIGAHLACTATGQMSGSVSGGCVEAAVVEAGMATLKTGQPQLLHFGVADETAWDVGLACGGSIEVFVRPLKAALFEAARAALLAEQALAIVTVIQGPQSALGGALVMADGEVVFSELKGALNEAAKAAAREALDKQRSGRMAITLPGSEENVAELFVNVILPPPVLVMVGGAHIAIALATMARALGYRTVVIDPRKAFGSRERFPHVDRLIQAWPGDAFAQFTITGNTAIATLTHDAKIDDPALKIALSSPAFYVGALGSRATQEKRRQRLLAAGLSEEQLARLHGPIGLDLGGRTPEEIALAVMAEIVAARHGQARKFRSGR